METRNQYRAAYWKYRSECFDGSERLQEYFNQSFLPGNTPNWEITLREIHRHCENCLGHPVPYEALIGIMLIYSFQLYEYHGELYTNLSNASLLMRIRHGDRIDRQKRSNARFLMEAFGRQALDPILFDPMPRKASAIAVR